ncbi:PoNe immunity protein domain-containing protein [Mesonia sp. K4-1]|uniref:PoNe immunity protein domain-containing protein n=1 Tax=Mesonia sp. K4-1 TaxID=2602760 RepID=UPI0011CAF884|nr:PoNe immunity protein domain-containing protein [Mesonia sp. K4-1]TXK74410.1 DUF1910 domain-containing protein [Mesonia sp. K4-1]
MRGNLNSTGFSEIISRVTQAIPKYIEKINNQKDENLKLQIKRLLFNMLLKRTIALYSLGEEKNIINESLKQTIDAYAESFFFENGGDYEDSLWLISISLLCEIDTEYFNKIVNVIDDNNLNDSLFSLIIQNKIPTWENNSANPWDAPLYNIILNAENANDIKLYLDNYWYQAHQEAY